MNLRFGLLFAVALLALAACDDGTDGGEAGGGSGGSSAGGSGGSASGGDGGSASGGAGGSSAGGAGGAAMGGSGGAAMGGSGGSAMGGAGGSAMGGAGGSAMGGAGGAAMGGAGGSAMGGAGGSAMGGAGGSAGASCTEVCDHLALCSGGGDVTECVANCEADRAHRPVEVAVCIECLIAATCDGVTGGACDVACAPLNACPRGEALGADGLCHATCLSIEDCYPLGAYCASDDLCYGVLAGDDYNTCPNALAAAPMDASGPLIFAATQIDLAAGSPDLCIKEPGLCVNNGNVCGWSYYFYDPDGNVPATKGALYSKSFFLDDTGGRLFVYDVEAPDMAMGTGALYMCFDEFTVALLGAMQILDETNLSSNALCLDGMAP